MSANTLLLNLSDEEIIADFQDLVISEQEQLVLQLEHLAELDRRKLFREYSSLRAFLIGEFGMEEWLAERRIRAARLLTRFPAVREKLWSGKLNLSLLEIVQGYGYREKLSDPELRCVLTNAALETLEDIRGLLSHSHPGATLGELIGVIADEYRQRHHPEERATRAMARRKKKDRDRPEPEDITPENPSEADGIPALPRSGLPRTESRATSREIEHEMVLRSGYRCEYVEPANGERCTSRHGLERDHVVSWADGGATSLANLRYVCQSHHRRISYLRFGESSKYIRKKRE